MRAIALSSLLILVAVSARAIEPVPPIGTGLGIAAADNVRDPLTMGREAVAAMRNWAAKTWQTTKSATLDTAAEFGAPILANRIAIWRKQAIEDGTQPMPVGIREELVGYFSEALLDRVRYRIGWSERWPLHASLFRLIDVRALALFDVIVFRDQAVAADPVIWAHELAHVHQYDDWGLPQFFRRYIRDPDAVESEAWECSARYTMWALQEGRLGVSARPAERL
jgi:Domain of unknown function (DUF4157)